MGDMFWKNRKRKKVKKHLGGRAVAGAGAAGRVSRLSGAPGWDVRPECREPGARGRLTVTVWSSEGRLWGEMREGLLGAARSVPRDTEEPRCPAGGQSDTTKQKQHGLRQTVLRQTVLRQTVCLSAGAHAPTPGFASAPQMLCRDGDGDLETGLSGRPNP